MPYSRSRRRRKPSPPKNVPPKKDGKTKPPDAAQTKKKTAAELEQDDDDGKNPYGLAKDDDGVKRCPNCVKELESADDRICLHCGFDLETRKRHERKAVRMAATGGEKFQWLLPGILCALAAVAIISLAIWSMLQMKDWLRGGWFHEEENGVEKFNPKPGCFDLFIGRVCRFGIAFHLGKFAYRRLVLNNKPPEREIKKEDADAGEES